MDSPKQTQLENSMWGKMRGPMSSQHQINKILAIKLRAIGDCVIWTAALKALRQKFPHAEIHALTMARNAPVLQHHPAVDHLHLLSSNSRWELARKLWSLRSEGFDWLLGYHATTSLCRWAWLAGAKQKILHHHSWKHSPWGSVKMQEPNRLENVILRDHRVLEAMAGALPIEPQLTDSRTTDPRTIAPSAPATVSTEIVVPREDLERAESHLRQVIQDAGGDPNKKRYFFLPGGTYELRRYPKDLWLPLVTKVRDQGDFQPVVLGDSAISQMWNLREEMQKRGGIALIDNVSLPEFIALLATGTPSANKALANDSSPSHIAMAVGVPTSMFIGPGCIGDWFPYSAPHRVLWTHVNCRNLGPRTKMPFQYCLVEHCSHHSCLRSLKFEP